MIPEAQKETLKHYKRQYRTSKRLCDKAFFASGINSLQERYGIEKTHYPVIDEFKSRYIKRKKGRKPDKGYVKIEGELKEMVDYIYRVSPNDRIAMILMGYPEDNKNGYKINSIREDYVPSVKKNYMAIKEGRLDPKDHTREGNNAKDVERTRKLMQAIHDKVGSLNKASKYVGMPMSTYKNNMARYRPSKETEKKVKKAAKRLGIAE